MKFLKSIFGAKSLGSVARKVGYVKDQMGIQNRYVREQQQWQSHLENTKQYILDFVENMPKRSSIAVLGSGWLLDVPIEKLAEQFETVYLYDIVHPEQIVVRMSHFPNVRLQTCDLTGGAVLLAERAESFQDFLDGLQTLKVEVDFSQYDAVVSVNLLNQLDILLCDFLSKKFSVKESDLKQVRKFVQQLHVNGLPAGKSCLITDVQEQNLSLQKGNTEYKDLIYCELPQSNSCREWVWKFDTNQMYHKGMHTFLKVHAMQF